MKIDYTPPKSLEPLFRSTKFWNIVVGPVGSAKTTACIFRLLMAAARQAPGKGGIRRTRFVISRTTFQQLKMTVLRDIEYWLGPLIRWRPSDSMILIDQPPIYSEWYLVPLETTLDQRRLLSLQLSGAWFNEGREIPGELIYAAAGRIPRYPPATEEGVTWPFILIDSNPGEIGGDLYKMCERARNAHDMLYIHQGSGVGPDADWKHFLPDGYYERLMEHASPDWIDVHVHGRWGRDRSGAGVFTRTYEPDVHERTGLEVDQTRPLVIGLDPGRQPGAVLTQVQRDGTLYVLREAHAENCDLRTFLTTYVKPWTSLAPLVNAVIVMDPAGRAKVSTANESPFTVARQLGFDVVLAETNDIGVRIAAVDRLLVMRGARGAPMIVVDAAQCRVLSEGLRGAYRFRVKKDGATFDEKPLKIHPTSDVIDALQYVAMTIGGRKLDRFDRPATFYEPPAPALDLTGWV